MREGPALILALAIIVSGQSVKNVKTGPCFKFKVTNGDNVTKIDLEHDEGSTIEASADSCNGRRILNISILTSVMLNNSKGELKSPDLVINQSTLTHRATNGGRNKEAAPVKRHPDYELFPGIGYYRLHPNLFDWESAQAACKADGANLVVINSDAEKNVAVSLLRKKYPSCEVNCLFWIGLKRDVGGEIKTVFGDPMSKTGYAVWERGEPNKDGDCVFLRITGGLADTKCDIRYLFICEQPL